MNASAAPALTWIQQLTACIRWQHRMNADISANDHVHRCGESATHPIELYCGTLAALLLLAGSSPQRRHALPTHRSTAHSGVSNCRI
jgi:hypothetical protein